MITWLDDGNSPLLSTIGSSQFALYYGTEVRFLSNPLGKTALTIVPTSVYLLYLCGKPCLGVSPECLPIAFRFLESRVFDARRGQTSRTDANPRWNDSRVRVPRLSPKSLPRMWMCPAHGPSLSRSVDFPRRSHFVTPSCVKTSSYFLHPRPRPLFFRCILT